MACSKVLGSCRGLGELAVATGIDYQRQVVLEAGKDVRGGPVPDD